MLENATLVAALPASDLERAKKWYSETLGLEPEVEDPFGGAMYLIGGSRFLVYESEFAGTNKATAAGIEVGHDEFDDVVAHLRQKGAKFEDVDFGEMGHTEDGVIQSEDGSMKGAWFKDSEGNILGLSTPMP